MRHRWFAGSGDYCGFGSTGVGLAGGKIASGISTLFNIPGITTGAIVMQTSPNVMIGGIPAARAKLDGATCNGLFWTNHFPNPAALVAQGSSTVYINGMPAARVGDKLICSATIQKGENTVVIGGNTVQVLPIFDAEAIFKSILEVVALVSGVIVFGAAIAAVVAGTLTLGAFAAGLGLAATFGVGSWAAQKYLPPGWNDIASGVIDIVGIATMGKLTEGLGEPIYPPTGEVVSMATDFILPAALELRFERYYASELNQQDWLGPNWSCTWGQRVTNTGAGVVYYYPGDGRRILYELNGAHDEQGWLRNAEAGKVRLRPTLTGFEVRNDKGHLQRFDRAVGHTWLITAIEDRNGNTIHFHYDDSGALRTVDHSGGYRLRVSGTAAHITSIALEQIGGTLETLVSFTYDSAGCLSGVDNGSGQLLRYEYDSAGRMTRWTDRQVTFTEYTYDEYGRCVSSVGAGGMYHYSFSYDTASRTTTAMDSYGGVTVVRYNERKRVIARHDPNGNVTSTTWDERGNKVAVTDPEMRRTEYQYDADGNLLCSTNAAGESNKFEYNELGLPTAVTDPVGKRWLRQYDERGNVTEAGLDGGPAWQYQYDQSGNLVSATDPTSVARRYTYNTAGLVLTATDGEGHTRRYRRDEHGRVAAQIDALGHETQFRYNTLNKLGLVVLPDEAQIQWGYDPEGNITTRIGADGGAYRYSYGAYDKLQSIQRPSGAMLNFGYDLEARLSQVTNERGETWDYEYDKASRMIHEKEFSGRTQHYRYDASGFLVERTNGNGETIAIERDKAGRMLKKKSSDGAAAEFMYDANGLLTRAQNQWTTVEFERDEYGRVLREKQGDQIVESFYDGRGLRTKRRANGEEIKWRYVANGRLESRSLPGDDWLEFKRDAVGRDTERRLKTGGFVLHQEFDPMSRLTGQVTSANSLPVSERRWQYDVSGDPTVVHESLWGESHFSYDADGRLRVASRHLGVSEEFHYDAAGEIASVRTGGFRETAARQRPAMGTLEMRFIGQGGRLEKVGETSYFYDADGRTVEKREGNKGWRYEWTAESQLRAVITPDGEHWTYEYDPFGRRIKKSGPRGTTIYVWDGAVVAQEITSDRSSSWFFEPGTFRPMAKVENGKAYACVTDQVGTPRELMTCEGKLAWSAGFTAFGELDIAKANETDCPIRFQGQWFDAESGLHYNFNRYYDPETGKYLTADPIGLNGGTRSYGYVHNPLAWVDPWGLAGCVDPPQTTEELQARAAELNSTRDPWSARNGTTAVIRGTDPITGQPRDFIATEGTRMPPEWEGQLNPNEQFIGESGHAEESILNSPQTKGYSLTEGGTSRNVCRAICEPALTDQGFQLGGPAFRGMPDKTPYRMFWKP